MLWPWKPREPEQGGLADECEAFLLGRAADRYRDIGAVVPCWAWLNELAHRTPDELRALALGRRSRARVDTWTPYVDTIAHALVEWARHDLDLERWQVDVLVPLELDLVDAAPRTLGPADLVQLVLARVVEHRRARSGGFLSRAT